MINYFKDEYSYLNNSYPCQIKYEGITYRNSEAAFQACKVFDEDTKIKFSKLNASEAKKLGMSVSLRNDWDKVKESIMYKVVKAKFVQNPILLSKLIKTNDQILINSNYWHDNYWGTCTCQKCSQQKSLNKLGHILMKVRSDIKEALMNG